MHESRLKIIMAEGENMQFHLNGFTTGDPTISPSADTMTRTSLPAEVDVLIVGCGPAGLILAAQLAAFPDISTAIIERKDGPLLLGQADGISCRSMEMFQAFGFAREIEDEAYWVNEVSFWKPDAAERDRIIRSGRVQDVEDGLSESPHVILNQARVHDRLLRIMRHSPRRLEPFYSREITGLEISDEPASSHPVTVTIESVAPSTAGQAETVRARYVVGCDGARSFVRKAIGRELKGDSANQAWGVMDVLAVTNFPDIRMKCAIHSADEGSALIIPREGGYLTRLYIELDKLKESERLSEKNVTIEKLIAAAQRIFHPYQLDVKEVAWWSCYEIGQRLCDRFDDVPEDRIGDRPPHVFIAGDACHTHSPKAGQGMNVSMGDTFNLGWKLAAVLRQRAKPDLLASYSAERQTVAKELIDFDREFAAMFSARPKDENNPDGVDPAEFQRYFVKQGRFTAGTAVHYRPSMIQGEASWQALAQGWPIGMRFHSAPVVRLADAKPLQLGHVVEADGRWRLFAFAGQDDDGTDGSPIAALCAFLGSDPRSPVRTFTREGDDPDAVIDVRAVFQQGFRDLSFEAMPAFLKPRKGRYGLVDYEKIYCADLKRGTDIFAMRGIDREHGCVVIVRPDQYVAHVVPLDGFDEIARFFSGFMI